MSPKLTFISLFYLFLLFLSQTYSYNDYDFHNEWDEQGHPKDNRYHHDHQDYDGGRDYGSEYGRKLRKGHQRGRYQQRDDLHFYSGADSGGGGGVPVNRGPVLEQKLRARAKGGKYWKCLISLIICFDYFV